MWFNSRCGKVEGDNKKYKIFTIVNPLGSSKLPSYLQRWDPKSFTIEQVIVEAIIIEYIKAWAIIQPSNQISNQSNCYRFQAVSMSEGSLSALAVSDSGDFVATGSMFDGTVEIYIAYNLRVRKP